LLVIVKNLNDPEFESWHSPQLVLRLRISAATPLLPLYTIMTWTGAAVPFFYMILKSNFVLTRNFFLFPFTDIRTRTTNKFTVQYDIYKTLLQWNQSINAGILTGLTHFYSHYTRETAAASCAIDRSQCIQMKLQDVPTTCDCISLPHL
jgi:hypothetical protein